MNYGLGEGILHLETDPQVLSLTHMEFTGDSGRLCPVSECGSEGVDVGRSFYSFPIDPSCPTDGVGDTFETQEWHTCLVVKALIDSRVVFYPIQIVHPQPNTVYNIEEIRLRSSGSPYSNFIQRHFSIEVSFNVSPWGNTPSQTLRGGYHDDRRHDIFD